jgi:hypothetical protein
MNAPDYKYPFLRFDFALHVGRQPAVTRIDSARFQRTPKGSHHSTRGGGDNIVDCRGMRFCQRRRVNFVVLGDSSVDAKYYRFSVPGPVFVQFGILKCKQRRSSPSSVRIN